MSVVLLGGTLAIQAAASSGLVAAQPATTPVVPTNPLAPVPPGDPCPPGSPLPVCHLPAPPSTPSLSGIPLPVPTGPPTTTPCIPGPFQPPCAPPAPPSTGPSVPCTGEGCIPQPPGSTPPTGPGPSQPGGGDSGDAACGLSNIGGCITNAINAFFRGIVTAALNPLLDLLGKTLLTTPMPDSLPRVGELWNNSWQILLVSYGLLVLLAGVIAMGYQTVQTRHSIKELAPRLVTGFLAGALSLWVATKGIQIANAMVSAIMGGGVDASTAGVTLRNLVLGSLHGGIWVIFIGIFLAGLLVALLVTYVVRVALTIILIAGAPLALMFHVLPQTEGVAYWWWKAYGGCLAIQVGQSLTLIVGVNVFLAPGGFTLFGPTMSGLVNLLVALALMYILFKIPFWVLASVRGGSGGRSLIGSLIKGFLAYKTFGLLGRRGGGRGPSRPRRPTATAPNVGIGGGAGAASSAPLPWWAWRRRRAAKWIRPGEGMLPLRLRRYTGTSTVGQPRHTLADELADPARDLSSQGQLSADQPDLFGPNGQVRRHARPVKVDRPLIPPEPGMLPMRLRYAPPGATRSSLAGELSDPHRPQPGRVPMPPNAPGLVTRHGRANPAAKPPRVPRPLIPPQPGMLPMRVRRTDPVPQRRTLGDEFDARPAGFLGHQPSPPTTPGLFMRDGRPNRRATPPRHVWHPVVPPEPGMLPMRVRRTDPVPQRHTVGDEFDARPTDAPEHQPSPPRTPGLFTRDGQPNPRATPPKRKQKPAPRTAPPESGGKP
ncbi:hypothetical protein [Kibdelosporangium phytohabitans]|uniref:hypothetical protein n=1 Tax=Kibdelosporangium phytohabitans TaxID=860235 RepID=UPI0015CFB5F9|nr:hypothetical protein [Kibdelosporangium phytohabitans]MBE1468209.1 hypothetical protein [Kibdelosporangium phytohabitans]